MKRRSMVEYRKIFAKRFSASRLRGYEAGSKRPAPKELTQDGNVTIQPGACSSPSPNPPETPTRSPPSPAPPAES